MPGPRVALQLPPPPRPCQGLPRTRGVGSGLQGSGLGLQWPDKMRQAGHMASADCS